MSIANYENMVANALKRAIRTTRNRPCRASPISAPSASTMGKIELETMGDAQEDRVIEKLIQGAVVSTFNKYFSVRDFDDLVLAFDNGSRGGGV